MEKLKRKAKGLDVVFKILFWFVVAATGLIVLYEISHLTWLWLTPGAMAKYPVTEHLHLGDISLTVPNGMPAKGDMFLTYLMPYISIVISAAYLIAGICIIRHILKAMKAGTPFCGSVSRDFKKLGWVALIGGLCTSACSVIKSIQIYDLLMNVRDLILKDTVTAITYYPSFDFTFIIGAAILFLASYAFRYGEELQQLSDETL